LRTAKGQVAALFALLVAVLAGSFGTGASAHSAYAFTDCSAAAIETGAKPASGFRLEAAGDTRADPAGDDLDEPGSLTSAAELAAYKPSGDAPEGHAPTPRSASSSYRARAPPLS
jgi:hypothetical protein